MLSAAGGLLGGVSIKNNENSYIGDGNAVSSIAGCRFCYW